MEGIILTIGILIVAILVCRELSCWYFKINDHLKLMEKISENQQTIIQILKSEKQKEIVKTQTGEETKEQA